MKSLNRSTFNTKKYPTKIIQFGDGNFLRAFIDWMVHKLNKTTNFNAGIIVVKARPGKGKLGILNNQDGLYTLFLKGRKNGEVKNKHCIIDCINEGINPYTNFEYYFDQAENPNLQFIISNTTEAGIVFNAEDRLTEKPQTSFPAKVTAFLYQRFKVFNEDKNKGLIFFPCELIDNNGDKLRELVLKYAKIWKLETSFISWVINHNVFCNTLVDRIVSGYPKNRVFSIQENLGYKDELIVESEYYHLFVIEAPSNIRKKFPADTIGLNVIFTNDIKKYKTIKVRILNGLHTLLVPLGYLFGLNTVRECLENDLIKKFLKKLVTNEINSTLNFPEEELINYTNDVFDRFENPYLEHQLMSISLNSISKFKTRVLPSILEYIAIKNSLPSNLLFSLSALIVFYKGNRNGIPIILNDDDEVLYFFKKLFKSSNNSFAITQAVLSNTNFWETDLTKYQGLHNQVKLYYEVIIKKGMKAALESFYTLTPAKLPN